MQSMINFHLISPLFTVFVYWIDIDEAYNNNCYLLLIKAKKRPIRSAVNNHHDLVFQFQAREAI